MTLKCSIEDCTVSIDETEFIKSEGFCPEHKELADYGRGFWEVEAA